MASSKKPLPDLVSHVAQILSSRVRPGQNIALGLSGGLDSVVLLDILTQLRLPLNFSLGAIHVNHQLSPHASDWANFCTGLCREHDIPLEISHVTLTLAGNSLEAAARAARYEALAHSRADFIALAHHLDDQAETLLLQLLRGSGVAGASAMAEQNQRLLRPLLGIPRSALEHHASQRKLAWVNDESNLDTRFDRNFLRHHLLPVVGKRFPTYRETLYRASRNFAESTQLLDELAQLDAAGAIRNGKLSIPALTLLSPARARNLLRHYLKQHGIAAPSAIRLEDMLLQLQSARKDALIKIPLGTFELRRFLGQAWIVPATSPPDPNFYLPWQGENELHLPQLGGVLKLCPVPGQGISLARLQQGNITIRVRQGGERFQPDCKRPRRSLKNLFQETATPPWLRQTLPLLYSGTDLAAVVRIGIDCAFQARPDEPGIMLEWQT